jgi:hypothetical protein
MNLTLSADADVIRRAREAAHRQGRSLNDLIREQLEQLAGVRSGDANAVEFLRLATKHGGRGGERFTRSDAYDERRS